MFGNYVYLLCSKRVAPLLSVLVDSLLSSQQSAQKIKLAGLLLSTVELCPPVHCLGAVVSAALLAGNSVVLRPLLHGGATAFLTSMINKIVADQ
jgi:hypothetical protein